MYEVPSDRTLTAKEGHQSESMLAQFPSWQLRDAFVRIPAYGGGDLVLDLSLSYTPSMLACQLVVQLVVDIPGKR